MKIGFIGLGQMGRGMADRLLQGGHALTVWNRTRAVAETFGARGAVVAEAPDDLRRADVIVTMLADDAAVDAVWIASSLVERISPSVIHLNMASVSLSLAKKLAGLHRAAGTQYVSAPVFGRPEAAASGQLDIVAAGSASAIARCGPLFEALARRWFNVGPEPHHANIVKIARNFLLAAIIESLGEAFALVEKAGLDPNRFLEIITSTSMSSPAYKNYGKLILQEPAQPTFPLRLGLKDVELAVTAAEESGLALPLASLLRKQHVAAIEHGFGDREWASLAKYIVQTAERDT